jgi:hypothetical protein
MTDMSWEMAESSPPRTSFGGVSGGPYDDWGPRGKH